MHRVAKIFGRSCLIGDQFSFFGVQHDNRCSRFCEVEVATIEGKRSLQFDEVAVGLYYCHRCVALIVQRLLATVARS